MKNRMKKYATINQGVKMKSRILNFTVLAVAILYLLFFNTSNLIAEDWNIDSSVVIDSGYINVDNGKLFYEVAGKGGYIVLLHDGAVHREIWDEQFLVLAKSYRVVRYDRRGYGNSSNPNAPFSNINDLNQLFIQLNINKATIFGMSAGGGLVLDFALEYPEKVTALVLVGAVVSGYGYSSHMLSRGGRINFSELIKDPQRLIKYLGLEDPYEISDANELGLLWYQEILRLKKNLLSYCRQILKM